MSVGVLADLPRSGRRSLDPPREARSSATSPSPVFVLVTFFGRDPGVGQQPLRTSPMVSRIRGSCVVVRQARWRRGHPGCELVGGAFGQVLADQPVGVLVGAALPGARRVADVHGQAGVDGELRQRRATSLLCSQVRDRRSRSGRVMTCVPSAAATVSELIHSMRTSWVNRVERSTSVATAEPPVPQVRSPSRLLTGRSTVVGLGRILTDADDAGELPHGLGAELATTDSAVGMTGT